MPETGISTVVILLAACAGFLFLILLIVAGIRLKLGRIERLLAVKRQIATSENAGLAMETASGSAFDTFLSEDPARKLLTKKEQAAAYRQWRQENGMNWSNS